MPRRETVGWVSAGRGGRFGTVEHKPVQPIVAQKAILPAGGVTQPPPNPITGKPYRPGERLERQARQFAKKTRTASKSKSASDLAASTPTKAGRDYEAMIARALETLELSD